MVRVEMAIGILFIGCSLKYLHAAHIDATRAKTETATLTKANVLVRNLTGVLLFKNGTQPLMLPSNLLLRILLSDVSSHKKRARESTIWKEIRSDFQTIVASITIIDTVYKRTESPVWLRANIQIITQFLVYSKRYFLSLKNIEAYAVSLDWITTCARSNITSCIKAELAASKQINQVLSNVNYSTLTIWLRKIIRVDFVGFKKLIIVGEDGEIVINVSSALGNSLGLNYSELNVSSGSVITPLLSVILLILIL